MTINFTLPPGYVLYLYDSVASTNETAKDLLDNLCNKSVIAAHRQTHGKGKYGADWISPKGNLYFTLVLKNITTHKETISQLVFLLAVTLGSSIELDNVQYKWPNDILVNNKKVAGILMEIIDGNTLLIGVGVNLTQAPITGSYCLGEAFSYSELLSKILTNFQHYYDTWEQQGFGYTKALWLKQAFMLNQTITIKTNTNSTYTGIMKGISEDGALVLESDKTYYIYSGDLFT